MLKTKDETLKYNYNRKLVPHSRRLRKNMTPEERKLWYDFLKKLPLTVNRQKIIGSFIVDFYISSANIVIEIDGLQHTMPEHEQADRERDRELTMLGILVLRYTNRDINRNFDAVCQDILKHLGIQMGELKDI